MGSILSRISQRLRNAGRPPPRALILAYHRIASPDADPWALSTRPEHFAEHLDVIRSEYQPLPLAELTRSLRNGRAPDRAVVITFDDGYCDTLRAARPLLERAAIPATAFICSGAIDDSKLFWWDELTRILLRPGTLPMQLDLAGDDEPFRWDLGDAAEYSAEDADRHRQWRGWDPPAHPRQQFYAELWAWLRNRPDDVRKTALRELARWAGDERDPPHDDRPLNAAEIGELGRGGLVDIGAHTVRHPRLSTLSRAEQAVEINESKERLEAATGRAVTAFAYPFGGNVDYDANSVDLVKSAGFHCACAVANRAVESADDPYQLPRLYMQGGDGESLARILSSLLGSASRHRRSHGQPSASMNSQ